MVRLARVCPVGIPQHIIQRGNNRQALKILECATGTQTDTLW